MQVTVKDQDQSKTKKTLYVEVPAAKVDEELDNAYRELTKTVNIKGFRKGKAPRSVLEKTYGRHVAEDLAGSLVNETFGEALRESGLFAVGSDPRTIETGKVEKGEPFSYSIMIEVKPELPEIDFTGMTLKRKKYTASAEEVEKQLEELRKRMGTTVTVEEDRPAGAGDVVLIDYEGFIDGKPSDAVGKEENVSIKIGDDTFLKELQDGLLGMKKDEETDIPVKFPADYPDGDAAGTEAVMKVRVREIKEEVVPELNDDLARNAGDCENLEQLRSKIAKDLQSGYDTRSERELNEQIYQELISKYEAELPESLVNAELEAVVDEVEKTYAQREIKLEDAGLTRDGLKVKYRELAEKKVQRFLVLDKIAEQEGITVSDEELVAEYQRAAAVYGRTADELQSFYESDEDRLEELKNVICHRKAVQLVIEKNDVEEVQWEGEKEAEEPPKAEDPQETEEPREAGTQE